MAWYRPWKRADSVPPGQACSVCKSELTTENWAAYRVKKNSRMCRECDNERKRQWARDHPIENTRMAMAGYRRVRAAVISGYGGKCACCGESTPEFLTIDHIHGGGQEDRKLPGKKGGMGLYWWLHLHGYPTDDYRLLCYNCNFARGHHGKCPHEV